jgi:MFS family permease
VVLELAGPRFAGPRMVAVTLLVMTAAFGLNFGAGVFLAPLTAERGWGVGVLSVAAALSTLVGAVMAPAVGLLLDRIGPRRVVTGSIALLAVSYLLQAVSDQLWQFLVVYALLGGAGFAGSATLANSVLVARWYRRDRATMLGRTTLGITLGQILVLPLAGLLVGRFGTTVAYLVLGAVVLVAVVPVAGLLLRDDPAELGQHPDGSPSAALPDAAPDTAPAGVLTSRQRWGVASFGLHAFTLYTVVLHLPRLATDLGGGVGTGAAALALAAAVSGVTMLVGGPLADRHGHRPVLAAMHALRMLSLLAAAAATEPPQLFAVAVLFGLSSFPVIPVTTALLAAGRDPTALGGLLSRAWLVHQLAAGAGVLAAGLARSATGDYRPWLLLAAAAAAAGLLAVLQIPTLWRKP